MLRPFTACHSAHITCTSCFTIIHHFHSSYWSVAFSRSASSLPNITVRFPCQQFLGDYSGALVWKLRKCVIADNVGGERSSVCGGMPKGRVEWVAEMYIKRSWLLLGVHGLLRLSHTHTLCDFTAEFQSEEQIGKRAKQDLLSQLSSSRALGTEY